MVTKKDSKKALITYLKSKLLTYGRHSMSEPLDRLALWINSTQSSKVTLICPDDEPRRLAGEILKDAKIEYEVSTDPRSSSTGIKRKLSIPELSERIEDLPFVTDFWIQEYSRLNAIRIEFIPKLYLLSFIFLCQKRDSPTGLSTPALSYDKYVKHIKEFLDDGWFDKNPYAMKILQRGQPNHMPLRCALLPFAFLDDTQVTLPLSNFLNSGLSYMPEYRLIVRSMYEKSMISKRRDNIAKRRGNIARSLVNIARSRDKLPRCVRSICSVEFRNVFVSQRELEELAIEQVNAEQIQEYMFDMIRRYVSEREGMSEVDHINVSSEKCNEYYENWHELSSMKSLRIPDDGSWSDIGVAVLNDSTLGFFVDYNQDKAELFARRPVQRTCHEEQQVDKRYMRNMQPNRTWKALVALVRNQGLWPKGNTKEQQPRSRCRKKCIKDLLCSMFNAEEDPFDSEYNLKLEIKSRSSRDQSYFEEYRMDRTSPMDISKKEDPNASRELRDKAELHDRRIKGLTRGDSKRDRKGGSRTGEDDQ